MTALGRAPADGASPVSGLAGSFRGAPVLDRNLLLARQQWPSFVARLLEPFLFLFSIGIGVGTLVPDIVGPNGVALPYRTFVAPAMLVGSAMNAAVFASVIETYAKTKWRGSYASILASPISVGDLMWGELAWIGGYLSIQSTAFVLTMLAMGLIQSSWGLLLVPTAALVAFAFGGVGFLGSTYLRSWLDFDYITLVTFPLFLFSASFFPLERYPDALAVVVQLTPLYHGVDLARDLSLGTVDGWSLVSVGYLVVMGVAGTRVARTRLTERLQP